MTQIKTPRLRIIAGLPVAMYAPKLNTSEDIQTNFTHASLRFWVS